MKTKKKKIQSTKARDPVVKSVPQRGLHRFSNPKLAMTSFSHKMADLLMKRVEATHVNVFILSGATTYNIYCST